MSFIQDAGGLAPFDYLGPAVREAIKPMLDTSTAVCVVWKSPEEGDGWIDAWDGWYSTLDEALTDAVAGIGRKPWIQPDGTKRFDACDAEAEAGVECGYLEDHDGDHAWVDTAETKAEAAAKAVLMQRVGIEAEPWPSYAWPGGYAIFYLCDDGEEMCPDCMNKETDSIHFAGSNDGWKIVAAGAYGADTDYPDEESGPALCTHCNKVICEVVPS